MDTNCHGLSLTEGKYWIDNDQVDAVLKGGGLEKTEKPKVGDLVVYRGSYGLVVHTMTVTKVDAITGRVVEVSGLGGLSMAEQRCPPEEAWPKMGTTITYHTRKK